MATYRDNFSSDQWTDHLDIIRSLPEAKLRTIVATLCRHEGIKDKFVQLAVMDSKYLVCGQCDKPFDKDNNKMNDCVYHPGNFECDPDSDEWADDDGMISETEYNTNPDFKADFPMGFKWSCCEISGNVEGCETSRHEALIDYDTGRPRIALHPPVGNVRGGIMAANGPFPDTTERIDDGEESDFLEEEEGEGEGEDDSKQEQQEDTEELQILEERSVNKRKAVDEGDATNATDAKKTKTGANGDGVESVA
ncbi:hypothetical protein CTRI78_v008718 [Colletotrichum trifolii]|uniref:C2H2-type domain-containing protein n=1 Tax=Colletotrichum trifolii TaxID=5466 RepID=A0A4V3HU74_COLTR|nr:hypothetical protein CTRI78_v008718 [Colletotrichum trifolii]